MKPIFHYIALFALSIFVAVSPVYASASPQPETATVSQSELVTVEPSESPEIPVDKNIKDITVSELEGIIDSFIIKFFVLFWSGLLVVYFIKRISYAPDK